MPGPVPPGPDMQLLNQSGDETNGDPPQPLLDPPTVPYEPPYAPPPRSGEKPFHAALNGVGGAFTDQPLRLYNPVDTADMGVPLPGCQYRLGTISGWATTAVQFNLGTTSGIVWSMKVAAGAFMFSYDLHPDKCRTGIPCGQDKQLLLSTITTFTGRIEVTGYQAPVAGT